jgi:hypothetical protein
MNQCPEHLKIMKKWYQYRHEHLLRHSFILCVRFISQLWNKTLSKHSRFAQVVGYFDGERSSCVAMFLGSRAWIDSSKQFPRLSWSSELTSNHGSWIDCWALDSHNEANMYHLPYHLYKSAEKFLWSHPIVGRRLGTQGVHIGTKINLFRAQA